MVEFEAKLNVYSTLVIVAVAKDQTTHKIIQLQNKLIPTRDISLTRRIFALSN